MADPPSIEIAIGISGLTRQFGDFVAVDGVTLAIKSGEIFALIGPNGAGKSTLIKMLTTLLPPTSGTALIAGYDIVRQPEQVLVGRDQTSIAAQVRNAAYSPVLRHARERNQDVTHGWIYGVSDGRLRDLQCEPDSINM